MDHDHVFRDRFGEILPAVFTPDYAAHPDYDDANAATLTVQKTNKNVSCDACASKWSGEALDYDIARPLTPGCRADRADERGEGFKCHVYRDVKEQMRQADPVVARVDCPEDQPGP